MARKVLNLVIAILILVYVVHGKPKRRGHTKTTYFSVCLKNKPLESRDPIVDAKLRQEYDYFLEAFVELYADLDKACEEFSKLAPEMQKQHEKVCRQLLVFSLWRKNHNEAETDWRPEELLEGIFWIIRASPLHLNWSSLTKDIREFSAEFSTWARTYEYVRGDESDAVRLKSAMIKAKGIDTRWHDLRSKYSEYVSVCYLEPKLSRVLRTSKACQTSTKALITLLGLDALLRFTEKMAEVLVPTMTGEDIQQLITIIQKKIQSNDEQSESRQTLLKEQSQDNVDEVSLASLEIADTNLDASSCLPSSPRREDVVSVVGLGKVKYLTGTKYLLLKKWAHNTNPEPMELPKVLVVLKDGTRLTVYRATLTNDEIKLDI